MMRWALGAVALVVLLTVGAAALGRLVGRPGTRGAVLASVVALWLGAYVLWTFAGGLAVHYGLLARYETTWFAVLSLAGGIGHYRAAVRAGRERGLVVFVAGQLLWLVVVLVQNGAFPT